MRRRKSRKKRWLRMIFVVVFITIIFIEIKENVNVWLLLQKQELDIQGEQGLEVQLSIKENDEVSELVKEDDLPEELKELLEKNPDAREFVLNYALKKNQSFEMDLSEYENSETVPLLFQWDERWGYTQYGNNVMGLTGCGPTCLSMVCIYLLSDATYTPRYIADFAEENGYCVSGSGSAWTLISEGGELLGLEVIEIPLDENRIIKNLELGNPIICIMGAGDFTTTGHFIVMVGYEDGKIKINDPNSKINSEQWWDYERIKGQIRNLWVCRKLSGY